MLYKQFNLNWLYFNIGMLHSFYFPHLFLVAWLKIKIKINKKKKTVLD